ncbi:MAG: STAS domain-containing protein [Chlorobiales bacterium]|nr:STAS domain-containing protein [Chlorobiales bacterium]
MKYEINERGDVSILQILEPRLIYESLDPIQKKFISLVESGIKKIVIDFSKVDYLDSFAVGFIMDMYRRVSGNDGALKICGLQPRVRKILSITRVDNVVDICTDIDDAVAAFNGS